MTANYDTPFLTLLSAQQHADLKDAARSEGVSMADIMRDALTSYLASIGTVSVAVHLADDDPDDYEPTA